MAKFGLGIASIMTAAALSSGGAQGNENQSGFTDVIHAGGPVVERVLVDTRTATSGLIRDSEPVLIAQAQETDGKIYVAEVIQVDGTKKTIQYTKNARGVIIAPPVVDGKLVDGSKAPDNAVEARIAQKDILVRYDRGALLMLAYVSKQDILREADKNLDEILSLSEHGKIISKAQLFNGFYSAYIYNISMQNGKADSIISTLESIGKIRMRLSTTELTQLKQDARLKAVEIWKSVTGAVMVG